MPDYPIYSAPDDEPEKQPADLPSVHEYETMMKKKKADASVPDMYERIEGESTALGRLASKIPGFKGYVERGRRREADQILRDTIAARLEEQRLRLANVHQDLSGDIVKAIDYAEPLGRADSRLMGLIGKIKSAPQGYAGFFDAVKVKEDDLARLYDFDANMLNYAEQIAADIAALQYTVANDGNIREAIRALDATLQEASSTFNSRQELLSGVA